MSIARARRAIGARGDDDDATTTTRRRRRFDDDDGSTRVRRAFDACGCAHTYEEKKNAQKKRTFFCVRARDDDDGRRRRASSVCVAEDSMVEIQDGEDAVNAFAQTRAQEAKSLEAVTREMEARDAVEASDEDDDDDDDESGDEFTAGPTVWEAAADEEIPENHWEYHMRKNMNDGKGDSVYRNLSYVPVCNCAPVCVGEKCRNPYWMWTKKR